MQPIALRQPPIRQCHCTLYFAWLTPRRRIQLAQPHLHNIILNLSVDTCAILVTVLDLNRFISLISRHTVDHHVFQPKGLKAPQHVSPSPWLVDHHCVDCSGRARHRNSIQQKCSHIALRKTDNIRLLQPESEEHVDAIELSLYESLFPPVTTNDQSTPASRQEESLDLTRERYYALSYVCGDPTHKLRVFLDDTPFSITTNLHDFHLTARHSAGRGGPYWVDVICINQRDEEEKSTQIAMMGDIYESTHKRQSSGSVWQKMKVTRLIFFYGGLNRRSSLRNKHWRANIPSVAFSKPPFQYLACLAYAIDRRVSHYVEAFKSRILSGSFGQTTRMESLISEMSWRSPQWKKRF